jgi:RimJ/RimL family protein N-acetyltransferase
VESGNWRWLEGKKRFDTYIRRAAAKDAGEVVEIINAVCAERLYMITTHYVPTPNWEQVLHSPPSCSQHLLLVPEVESQIVGWCRVFSGDPGQGNRHVGDVGIGLLKPFREMGIGTALMERAIDWARGQGLERLTADTFSTNLRAIHLFKKMGFVITGERYARCAVNGNYVDRALFLMERFL